MSLLPTYGFGIAGPTDTLAPSITLISPAAGSAIARDTPLIFDVTDETALGSVFLSAGYAFLEALEVAYAGGAFSEVYNAHSAQSSISGGIHLTLRRKEIWPSAPMVTVDAWDAAGNHSSATFSWTLVADSATASAGGAEATDLPRDLLLDADGDLDITTGDFQLTTGKEAITQALDISFGLVKGEWFLDLDAGFDLFGLVLVSHPNQSAIQDEIRRVALLCEGVISVPSITLELNRPARTLSADITVLTDVGELEHAIRLGATP